MNKLTTFIARPEVYKTAIFLYVLLLIALAIFSFSINTRDIRTAVYIRGASEVEAGATLAMRGLFHYAPTGEILRPASMSWSLISSENDEFPLSFLYGDLQENWPDIRLQIPEDIAPGSYSLVLRAGHERFPPLEVSAEIEINPATLSDLETLSWPEAAAPRDENAHRRGFVLRPQDSQGLRLEVLPRDGEILRGMEDRIFLRLSNEETGHPLRATLALERTDGLLESTLPESLRTNSLGLVELPLIAATDLVLQVKVQGQRPSPSPEVTFLDGDAPEELSEFSPATFRLQLYTVPAQFLVQPRQPVFSSDELIGTAHSVLRDFTYMVDLYAGEQLLETLSLAKPQDFEAGPFLFEISEETTPLLRLQVYQGIYGTTHGWDSRYVYQLEDSSQEAHLAGAQALYSWLATHRGEEYYQAILDDELLHDQLSTQVLTLAIEAGLADIPRHFALPEVLFNSRQTDREALELWRADVKKDLNLLMALLLLGGVAVFLYFVLLGVKRHQQEALLLAEVDLEVDLETSAEDLKAIQLERLTVIAQGAVVVFTLLAFALGILLVVSYL